MREVEGMKCGVWSVKCGVWIVECDVESMRCGVWSVVCAGLCACLSQIGPTSRTAAMHDRSRPLTSQPGRRLASRCSQRLWQTCSRGSRRRCQRGSSRHGKASTTCRGSRSTLPAQVKYLLYSCYIVFHIVPHYSNYLLLLITTSRINKLLNNMIASGKDFKQPVLPSPSCNPSP